MLKGFVRIPRRLFDTKWWCKSRVFSESEAIIYLYQSADRKNNLSTSLRSLADEWLWEQTKVLRFLQKMEKEGYVSISKTPSGTNITIIDLGQSATLSATPSATPKSLSTKDSNDVGATPSATPDATLSRAYKNEDNISSLNREDNKDSSLHSESKALAKDVVEFYNNTIKDKNLIKCIRLTDKRKKAIDARIKESGIDKVYEAITKAANSRFLNGSGERGWKADIDFIINPNSFVKILEGKYDDRKSSTVLPQLELENSPDKYENDIIW